MRFCLEKPDKVSDRFVRKIDREIVLPDLTDRRGRTSHEAEGIHLEPKRYLETLEVKSLLGAAKDYTFFTNFDFNCMAPMPSILQSMS